MEKIPYKMIFKISYNSLDFFDLLEKSRDKNFQIIFFNSYKKIEEVLIKKFVEFPRFLKLSRRTNRLKMTRLLRLKA